MPDDPIPPPPGDPPSFLRSPLFLVALVLALFTLSDLSGFGPDSSSQGVQAQQSSSSPKEVPVPKYASMMAGPTIRFMYWVFEQYAGLLQQKYPHLSIEGDNFPPANWRMQLAQAFGVAKMALLVAVVGNINPFPFLGFVNTPNWFVWMTTNKLYAGLMVFFVCNAIETQLISTGAFEIVLDNLPVWSKIESGRIPQPQELFQIIDNHFKMNAADTIGGGGDNIGTTSHFRDEL